MTEIRRELVVVQLQDTETVVVLSTAGMNTGKLDDPTPIVKEVIVVGRSVRLMDRIHLPGIMGIDTDPLAGTKKRIVPDEVSPRHSIVDDG